MLAQDVSGDMEKFKRWLDTPNFSLGNLKPIRISPGFLWKGNGQRAEPKSQLRNPGLNGRFTDCQERNSQELFPEKEQLLKEQGGTLGSWEIILYAANRSLAMAEVAVHFTSATIPDDVMERCSFQMISPYKSCGTDLPEDRNTFPHPSTHVIGDQFIADNKCVLQIPSASNQGSYNLLINQTTPSKK